MRYEVNLATGEKTEHPDLPPVLATPAEIAASVAAKLNEVRKTREGILNRLAGIKDAARDDGDTVLVDACKAARLALLDITQDPPTDPTLVDAFIKARYDVITAGMPLTLLMAFAKVDA